MTTFADTNVLISLLDENHVHHAWCTKELAARKAAGPIMICDIVYCEFSVGMTDLAAVDAVISQLAFERIGHNDQALFRAGQAYKKYKGTNQGTKTGVLPDFLIGAVAEVMAVPLWTANSADFAGYFPTVQLITP